MNKRILIGVITAIILTGVYQPQAESNDDNIHFKFIKYSLAAWENNEIDKLKDIMNIYEADEDMPEKLMLDYWLFSKTTSDKIALINDLIKSINVLSEKEIYNDIAKKVSLNILQAHKKRIDKELIGGEKEAQSLYELSLLDNQGDIANEMMETIISDLLQLFIIRNDVLLIMINNAKKYLESENDIYTFNRTETLPKEINMISDSELIDHIMRRYIKHIVKKEINGRKFVEISLEVGFTLDIIILIGSEDVSVMDEVYENKIDPLRGKKHTLVDKVEPGWVLMMLSFI